MTMQKEAIRICWFSFESGLFTESPGVLGFRMTWKMLRINTPMTLKERSAGQPCRVRICGGFQPALALCHFRLPHPISFFFVADYADFLIGRMSDYSKLCLEKRFPPDSNAFFWLEVWNLNLIYPSIGNLIIPTDIHMFQRGRYTNHQPVLYRAIDVARSSSGGFLSWLSISWAGNLSRQVSPWRWSLLLSKSRAETKRSLDELIWYSRFLSYNIDHNLRACICIYQDNIDVNRLCRPRVKGYHRIWSIVSICTCAFDSADWYNKCLQVFHKGLARDLGCTCKDQLLRGIP